MLEKTPENFQKAKDYNLYGAIIPRHQHTPKFVRDYQTRLLDKVAEIVSLSEDNYSYYYNKWKDLERKTSDQSKTYRYGVRIKHFDNLISPQPYVETRHNFIEIINSLLEFKQFYNQNNPLRTDLI